MEVLKTFSVVLKTFSVEGFSSKKGHGDHLYLLHKRNFLKCMQMFAWMNHHMYITPSHLIVPREISGLENKSNINIQWRIVYMYLHPAEFFHLPVFQKILFGQFFTFPPFGFYHIGHFPSSRTLPFKFIPKDKENLNVKQQRNFAIYHTQGLKTLIKVHITLSSVDCFFLSIYANFIQPDTWVKARGTYYKRSILTRRRHHWQCVCCQSGYTAPTLRVPLVLANKHHIQYPITWNRPI